MAIVNDNTDAVFSQLEHGFDAFLGDLGAVGLDYIRQETPVRTGALRADNDFHIEGEEGVWTNTKDYAVPVELGHLTEQGTNVPANPFMQRGLARLETEAESIAREHFTQ